MTTGIRSDASGTFGALTFGGDDAVTFDATGIQAGSYKAGSIVDTDLTLSANSAPVKVALNAAGDAPIFACRAWVNFNGTGTVAIRASGNVSSITDNGTGSYTVNFTTSMGDANYSAPASCPDIPNFAYIVQPHTYAVGSIGIRIRRNGDHVLTDINVISVSIFR